jgi:hypothetical protein
VSATLLEELWLETFTPCKLCTYLEAQSAATRDEWNHALALPVDEVSHMAVVAVLKRRGLILTEASVRRHRRNHTEGG